MILLLVLIVLIILFLLGIVSKGMEEAKLWSDLYKGEGRDE